MSIVPTTSVDQKVADLEAACEMVGGYMVAAAAYDRQLRDLVAEIESSIARLQAVQAVSVPAYAPGQAVLSTMPLSASQPRLQPVLTSGWSQFKAAVASMFAR